MKTDIGLAAVGVILAITIWAIILFVQLAWIRKVLEDIRAELRKHGS